MLRTIISMQKEDKLWLEKQAKANHLPMAELVRRAIKHYRKCGKFAARSPIEMALQQTGGIWKNEEGLIFQTRIRDEWERE